MIQTKSKFINPKEHRGMDFFNLIFLLILIIGYAEFLKNPYES